MLRSIKTYLLGFNRVRRSTIPHGPIETYSLHYEFVEVGDFYKCGNSGAQFMRLGTAFALSRLKTTRKIFFNSF